MVYRVPTWYFQSLEGVAFFMGQTWAMLRGRSAGDIIFRHNIFRGWAGVYQTTRVSPHLHRPIATSGFPGDNNQRSLAESNLVAHSVAGIQTHKFLDRGNRGIPYLVCTATDTWTTESLQPTYPCCGADLNQDHFIRRNWCTRLSEHNHSTLDKFTPKLY